MDGVGVPGGPIYGAWADPGASGTGTGLQVGYSGRHIAMRLGVSGKIFVAYTALIAVFVASSALTLLYMHRARARVVASQVLFDVQALLDEAWRGLDTVPMVALRRPDPRRPLAFTNAEKKLSAAIETLERYQEDEHSARFSPVLDLTAHRRDLEAVRQRLMEASAELGAYEVSEDDAARHAFAARLSNIVYQLDRERRAIRGESRAIAARLHADGESARNLAVVIAIAGVFVALIVAASMLRTLRPLRILRARARSVAGGDYAGRVQVTSRDEIGDLAREFDAMAAAIEERERRLIRSEQLATIGRMASQITHEIRNPLTSIGLNAELLADHLGPEHDEARRLLGSISREVDRLSEITDNYLRFVRLPRGERVPEQIGVLLTAVLEFSRAELAQAGVEVSLHVEPDLPEVLVDEAQLRQALLNLLRNAREAMPEGGQLRASACRDRATGGVVLSLADTGPGIAPADRARIFEPFFSTKRAGTGLGLALVSQIVADHGGRVDVESPAEGGTVFRLVFPPHREQSEGGEARAGRPGSAEVPTAPVKQAAPEAL